MGLSLLGIILSNDVISNKCWTTDEYERHCLEVISSLGIAHETYRGMTC